MAVFVASTVHRRRMRPTPSFDPDAVAATYLAALQQPRNAWSFEVELRPWVERF